MPAKHHDSSRCIQKQAVGLSIALNDLKWHSGYLQAVPKMQRAFYTIVPASALSCLILPSALCSCIVGGGGIRVEKGIMPKEKGFGLAGSMSPSHGLGLITEFIVVLAGSKTSQ